MAVEAKHIHQGRYDHQDQLLTLLENAVRLRRVDIQDAVDQRLKKIHPKIYMRLIGPLHKRSRDASFQCYCNYPASHQEVCREILSNSVHVHCLTCDDCWEYELCPTWGYFGFTCGVISKSAWTSLCDVRAHYKFAG